jgi:hypothetical protein
VEIDAEPTAAYSASLRGGLATFGNEMTMKWGAAIILPFALILLASGIFAALLWLNLMYVDEFASKFALSDKVFGLHRLTNGLLFVQLLLTLALAWGWASVAVKKRKTEDAEPTPPGDILKAAPEE